MPLILDKADPFRSTISNVILVGDIDFFLSMETISAHFSPPPSPQVKINFVHLFAFCSISPRLISIAVAPILV